MSNLSGRGLVGRSRGPYARHVGDIRIGISGWRYAGWRGVFYPPGLVQRKELSFAARRFNSLEINGSFYSLQRPESYRAWYEDTPQDFVFAIKGSRFITHMKRLRDVETPLANFFASGLLCLEEKLGPILWQLPETLRYEEATFESFFRLLPHDTAAASRLARKHDARVEGRRYTALRVRRPIRHALEVRSVTCRSANLVALLRKHQIALVVADTAQRWPYFEDVTADFVYVRLHGDAELYASGYSAPALSQWATRVAAWSAGTEAEDAARVSPKRAKRLRGRDVYVYFDNDKKVRAPFDARALVDALRARGVSAPRS